MEVPSYRSIVKGAGIFGAAKAVNILTALVRTKCAAVLLGSAGVGLNALFNTVQLFMNQLLGLGLSTGSVKTLSEAYATHDTSYIDQHVIRVRHWGILCGVAAILLLALLSPLLSLLYFDTLHYVPHFMLLGVGVASLIVCEIEQSVMRSLQRSVRLAFSMLLTAICALIFTVPFYWWLGVRGVIFAIVSCAVASAFICMWQGHKTHPFHLDFGQFSDWKRFWQASQPMLRTGMAFVVTGLFLQGSDLLLQSVLATTASLTVVGLFKAGYQCAFTYPSMIFSGVANDYFPRLSAVADDDITGRRIVVIRQIRVMFLIALPVVIVIWILAPWVIRILLSKEFLPLVTMVRWSVLAILFKAIYLPLGYLPLALNKRLHFLILEGLSCLIHVVVVLIGFFLNGIDGIGIGIFVGGLLDLVLYVLFCRHHYNM
ncbi:MAG: oligosaccharide flippase family protein [Bacteroidales bacterium]|nr:oligosaccharide flippase family protein [Bacteroidales bacterium]